MSGYLCTIFGGPLPVFHQLSIKYGKNILREWAAQNLFPYLNLLQTGVDDGSATFRRSRLSPQSEKKLLILCRRCRPSPAGTRQRLWHFCERSILFLAHLPLNLSSRTLVLLLHTFRRTRVHFLILSGHLRKLH